jgi:DNA transformation protein and related proteins
MSPISARDQALDIAERINTPGRVTVSRFFAGAALVADGVQFGFVMKGSLYLRVDDKSRVAFEALGAAPFT